MQLKPITAILVLLLLSASLLVAGCTSSTNSNQAASSASSVATKTANTTKNATAKPTAATPTPQVIVVTVTPTPKIATMVGPYWTANELSGGPSIFQGVPLYQNSSVMIKIEVTAADGTHPCGPANYYIDRQSAGGKWVVNPSYYNNGQCYGGVVGGAGHLYLSAADTSKLSVGGHMMEIDYLGNGSYGPSQWIGWFR